MAVVDVEFFRYEQIKQALGTADNDHALVRVGFTVAVDGKPVSHEGSGAPTAFECALEQLVGAPYSVDTMEFVSGKPSLGLVPWDHKAFLDLAAKYCLRQVGEQGGFIRIENSSVTMRNNTSSTRFRGRFTATGTSILAW